jgi:cytochrome c peroxidase
VELGAGGVEDQILAELSEDAVISELYAEAYPETPEMGFHEVVGSLASYLRTLVSGNSAYDRYVYGDEDDALSDSAKRGLELFFSEQLECHHCHGGFNFTLASEHDSSVFDEKPFHNTGLYNVGGTGDYPVDNTGLYAVTGIPEDMGRFKAPTLRNIAVTGPYMHDGSVETLEEVIDIYARGGRLVEDGPLAGDGRDNPFKSGFVSGFEITEEERADLVAFLESLTDEDFLTDPALGDPEPQP